MSSVRSRGMSSVPSKSPPVTDILLVDNVTAAVGRGVFWLGGLLLTHMTEKGITRLH